MQNVRSGEIVGETTPRVLNVDVHRRSRADHHRSNGRVQRLAEGVFAFLHADFRRFVAKRKEKFRQGVFFRRRLVKILHRLFQSGEQFVGPIDEISILLKSNEWNLSAVRESFSPAPRRFCSAVVLRRPR